ncbi:MAG TPA: ATP-binding protein, partial [Vicinamibacterales bacterium]
ARLGGGIPVSPQHGDLAPLITRVVEEQQRIHPTRAIQVTASGDTMVRHDADRIAQALSNLVGNALQHGNAGTPVCIGVAGSADAVRISITNDGAVDAKVLPHLFDPFRAGSQRGAATEGLGLGLYIAQQIVSAHGGEITVDADSARHTSFLMLLPR